MTEVFGGRAVDFLCNLVGIYAMKATVLHGIPYLLGLEMTLSLVVSDRTLIESCLTSETVAEIR